MLYQAHMLVEEYQCNSHDQEKRVFTETRPFDSSVMEGLVKIMRCLESCGQARDCCFVRSLSYDNLGVVTIERSTAYAGHTADRMTIMENEQLYSPPLSSQLQS